MELEVLRHVKPEAVAELESQPIDGHILEDARSIVQAVRNGGDESLRGFAIEYDGLGEDAPLVIEAPKLEAAYGALEAETQRVLTSTADRIESFATSQMNCLTDLDTTVPGGRGGHTIEPLERAGCYAPGGGYPLPSSVLMTAIPARVAGVEEIIVASPDPGASILGAAHVSGVDRVLTAGGAQAMAALGFGTESIPACDIVAGPGGPWVTAGKKIITGFVRTDFMAGPTELAILADETADPELVAADLIAQAEHAPEALPVLITTDVALIERTDAEVVQQLGDMPTAAVAREAFETGFVVLVDDLGEGASVASDLAPEHLQLVGENAINLVDEVDRYGTLFIGEKTPEAFGDYGIGPNHVLPTGGAARFTGGLSVFDFLRMPTWLEMNDTGYPSSLKRDIPALARMEGLEGHARAAERRLDDE